VLRDIFVKGTVPRDVIFIWRSKHFYQHFLCISPRRSGSGGNRN
jgi:hypothetical protein